MGSDNATWQLEEFVDSLVVELDRAREALAVKAINKPLSYTVKDLALDLNIFPSYDGDQVRFLTAQPGQQGASKITIQLASITDQQVRATTKVPGIKSDITIDDIPVDSKTKRQLRKLGVTSVDDLRNVERKNVDLQKVSDNEIDYKALANQIQKSRRDQNPPRVFSASLSRDEADHPCLLIRGKNLLVDPMFRPVAVLNGALAEVISGSDQEMKIDIAREHAFRENNEIILTFDPFAIVKMNVRA